MRLALALLLTTLPFGPAALAQDEPRRVAVMGEGSVEAAPDLATLTAGVQFEAGQAAAALGATAEAMGAVLAALEAEGVRAEDIQTSQISVDPLWDDGGNQVPRVRGYAATNLVTIKVRDLARLGAVIDSVGAAGANRIVGVGFELADSRARLDEARKLAVEDARAKATLLAEMAMDMPIAPGVVVLGARVEIVYAIE